ncbi:hypothetical protein [Kineococcus sp. SYSU DK002]|uniref:hypothetical protein n=1 Tax=Kineococcus sp. SYSU DK002 TaxID=3383123 RepID=UPI003D7CAE4D
MLAGAVAGCAAPRAPLPPPTTPATPTAATGPVPTGGAPAATALTLTTAGGLVLATTVEGGASLEDPAATGSSPPMLRWYAEPGGAPGTYVLRNAATTDDRDVCLQVPAEGTVSSGTCGPSTDQRFELAARGPAAHVLRSPSGFVVAAADGGLTTSPDAAAATPFVVSDADRAGTVPDL